MALKQLKAEKPWPAEVPAPAPMLSAEEHAEAERVARRLHEELRVAIELLPESQRGASVMARTLGIDRATCQRIVGVASRAQIGPDSLVQLPGIQGLRQFLRAMGSRRGAKAHAEQLAAAGAAVDRFEELIEHLGGSQRRLRLRLGFAGESAGARSLVGGADDPVAREALFRAAAAVTGRWSETTLETRIVRPVPGHPLRTEGVRLRGLLGHMARHDAVPLEMGENAPLRAAAPPGPAFATLDARPASGHTPGSLLHEFCTTPLPRVISRSSGNRVVHVIDTAESPDGRADDIVMAHRAAQPDRHPATLRPPIGEMMFLITFPTRRLIFDVYLHRDIARRCIPSVEVHLTQDAKGPGMARWSTQFPGGPRLEVLSGGPAGAGHPASPRQADMIGHALSQLGWNPADFVGYRCEAMHPIWRAGYCMLFDFTGNELDEGSGG